MFYYHIETCKLETIFVNNEPNIENCMIRAFLCTVNDPSEIPNHIRPHEKIAYCQQLVKD